MASEQDGDWRQPGQHPPESDLGFEVWGLGFGVSIRSPQLFFLHLEAKGGLHRMAVANFVRCCFGVVIACNYPFLR